MSSSALAARLLLVAVLVATGACSVREPAARLEAEGEIGRHPIVERLADDEVRHAPPRPASWGSVKMTQGR